MQPRLRAEVEPTARWAVFVFAFALAVSALLRQVAHVPVIADLVGVGGALVSFVLAVIALVRIFASQSGKTGAARAGIVACLSLALFGLVALPNFLAARGRAEAAASVTNACNQWARSMQNIRDASEELQKRLASANIDQKKFGAALDAHARLLRETSNKVAELELDPTVGVHSQLLATRFAALGAAYEGFGFVVSRHNLESVPEWTQRIQNAEQELDGARTDLIEMCQQTTFAEVKRATTIWSNVPEKAVVAQADQPAPDRVDIRRAADAHEEARKKLTYYNVNRADNLTNRRWIGEAERAVKSFKATNEALRAAGEGRAQFPLELCELDAKMADLLLARLALLKKNLGKWTARGGQPMFQFAAAEEEWQRLSRELAQIESAQARLVDH